MSENVFSRSKLNEKAFEIMYAFLIRENLGIELDIQNIIEEMTGTSYEECDVFLKEILIKALKNQKEIIEYVSQFLKDWKFKRLTYVNQAILILSIANSKYIGETEKAVVINIAIKLAKKYGSDNDYKFINAVLDKAIDG